MGKYYKLNKNFLLRGWQRLPYAIVDASTGFTKFLNKKAMDTLNLANGEIDFDLPLISDETRNIAETLEKEKIITLLDHPSEIEKKQEYRFHDNRFMEAAHWSVTGRCNYKCKHCYMSACENKYGELSHEDALEIIHQMAECGIHRISLTGGEPFVRKDFFELVDALIAEDIRIFCIYSNGRLINEKTLGELEKRDLHPEINMSFDGTEGWHSWLRGVEDADETIDRAFKLCSDHGFPTGAEMCLHDRNKHTLRDSVNYLASVGCKSLKTNPIADIGAWHDGGYGRSIDKDELYDLYLDYIPQYFEDGKPLSIMLGGFFAADPGRDGYTIPCLKSGVDPEKFCVCGHARLHMYISAEGRVLPCMALSGMDIQENYPLLPEKGLKYCLTESEYMRLITARAKEIIDHNDKCRSCEFAAECCGGCRAGALESTPLDIMGIDEATCRIFKGGYIDKIAEAVGDRAGTAKKSENR